MGTLWAIVLGVIILALVYVFFNYRKIKFLKEGTDEMVEMAGIIRSGANTFIYLSVLHGIKIKSVIASG